MHTDMHKREQERKDQGDASTSPGVPKIANQPPEARREAWIHRHSPRKKLIQPCAQPSSQIEPSELKMNKFLLSYQSNTTSKLTFSPVAPQQANWPTLLSTGLRFLSGVTLNRLLSFMTASGISPLYHRLMTQK